MQGHCYAKYNWIFFNNCNNSRYLHQILTISQAPGVFVRDAPSISSFFTSTFTSAPPLSSSISFSPSSLNSSSPILPFYQSMTITLINQYCDPSSEGWITGLWIAIVMWPAGFTLCFSHLVDAIMHSDLEWSPFNARLRKKTHYHL